MDCILINTKKVFLFFLILLIYSNSFTDQIELGEDLKGECISTLADQGRSELFNIKADSDDVSEEDSSGTTEPKSK